jgi:hypothetical protein
MARAHYKCIANFIFFKSIPIVHYGRLQYESSLKAASFKNKMAFLLLLLFELSFIKVFVSLPKGEQEIFKNAKSKIIDVILIIFQTSYGATVKTCNCDLCFEISITL